ncbi:MAG: recombinase family protein [Clostridiales bacterium]|nr:recombinase family protein [Clostridiales bacterium]
MRCVSYTRTVSNKPSLSGMQTVSIMEQNERIQNFAKEHGWKIEKKYSDRKKDANAEDAFLEMKEDGIARKFDCIITDSIYLCGNYASVAIDLFSMVFLPSGIHFAVVEDGFISSDVSMEAAFAYLDGKRKSFRVGRSNLGVYRFNETRQYPKYGYVYNGGLMELEIDEEPAAVIREIYRLAEEKHKIAEIARIMESRGIESPQNYMKRCFGFHANSPNGEHWTSSSVTKILDKRMYIGEWERTINGEKKIFSCPAIISREAFESVNERRKKRWKQEKTTFQSIFIHLIVDKDTGAPISLYEHKSQFIKIFRMAYPKPKEADYEKMWIPYDEVVRQVRRQLAAECKKAVYALQVMASDAGKKEKEARLDEVRARMNVLLGRMMEIETERAHCKKSAGNKNAGTGSAEGESDFDERFSALDRQMRQEEKTAAEIEQIFSEKNPWIKIFTAVDMGAELDRKTVKKYIKKIECVRFEYVTVYFTQQEWFQKLPAEWFMEGF